VDGADTMKQKLFLLIFAGLGVLVGIILCYGTYYGLHKTSDEKFCVLCHEMDPMVIAYKEDVHGGNGKVGASAKCVDCHLPHNNLIAYIVSKARNGLVEGSIHFFGNPDNINWFEKRHYRASFVFDKGCLECHGNILNNKSSTVQAQKMHKHYQSLQGTDKAIKCASCHIDAGHNELRNILNYYKPERNSYKDKMEQKKKEIQEKYQQLGIKQ